MNDTSCVASDVCKVKILVTADVKLLLGSLTKYCQRKENHSWHSVFLLQMFVTFYVCCPHPFARRFINNKHTNVKKEAFEGKATVNNRKKPRCLKISEKYDNFYDTLSWIRPYKTFNRKKQIDLLFQLRGEDLIRHIIKDWTWQN